MRGGSAARVRPMVRGWGWGDGCVCVRLGEEGGRVDLTFRILAMSEGNKISFLSHLWNWGDNVFGMETSQKTVLSHGGGALDAALTLPFDP